VRPKILVESGLALAAGLVAAELPYDPVRLWWRTPQGPEAAVVAFGLLVPAVIVGGLWADGTPVRLVRRGLVVLALLALVAGTGFLAVAWLVIGTGHTGRPSGLGAFTGSYPFARAISLLRFWPPTVFAVWVLGTMALLARRRFPAAIVYTVSAFGVLGITYAIIEAPAYTPQFAPVNFLTSPAWFDALFFLAIDAAVIYLGWTRLFRIDFVQPASRSAT